MEASASFALTVLLAGLLDLADAKLLGAPDAPAPWRSFVEAAILGGADCLMAVALAVCLASRRGNGFAAPSDWAPAVLAAACGILCVSQQGGLQRRLTEVRAGLVTAGWAPAA